MPELPEVETVKRSVESNICGKKILRVEVNNEDVLDGILFFVWKAKKGLFCICA